MMITAPVFLFAFLPFSVLFYVLFGKNRKKLCLGIVCAVYHVLFNMHDPINILWLPLLIAFSYFAARAVSGKKKVIAVALGAIPVLWLVIMRALEYSRYFEFVYPIGITLPALCAAAYVWDVAYGDEPELNIGNLALYLGFFAILLVGPFVGYSGFKRLSDSDNMEVTLSRCSSGIGMLALGFIKRIAVGAVLIDGYSRIFEYSWDAPNLAIIVLLVVLIYFGSFFSISGYYDMAVGLSRIYGLDLHAVSANPLAVATVGEYSASLFGSVREWSRKYILTPVEMATGKSMSGLIGIAVTCVCVMVFLRTSLDMLLLALPLIAFAYASMRLGVDGTQKKSRHGVRALWGLLTVLVIGVMWIFITMSGRAPLDISSITFENAEYQTDLVLMTFSGLKYLFVVILAIACLVPGSKIAGRIYSRLGRRACAVVDYGSMLMLLVMFVFAVMFFLPQFEIYDTKPFVYIVV